jgi:DNA-binding transcriptional LysR family regulator
MATDAGESAAFIRPTIVGMKYENVTTRSASTSSAAASHQPRAGPVAVHAANRFARVNNVRGPVVTYAQNFNPVSSRRAASAHGLHRDIAISVPSFAAAAAIASQTDWVAGMPRRMAAVFLRQMPLRSVAMPVPSVAFHIQLVWHERTHSDAGARFFRSLILEAVQARGLRTAWEARHL